MPPKRRSAGGAATRNQPTLSFNNRTRVTKQPNTLPPAPDTKTPKNKKRLSDQAQEAIIEQISTPEPEVAEVKVQPEESKAAPTKTVDEQTDVDTPRLRRRTKKVTESGYESKVKEATKLSDAKIRAYWKAEEDSRIAPRVHQKDVHLHEKILRHFDLSSQFGPCIGITRLERWKRASRLGMEPPVEVLAVLLKEESKGVDRGNGGRQCGQLAYIDELAGGRVVLVE